MRHWQQKMKIIAFASVPPWFLSINISIVSDTQCYGVECIWRIIFVFCSYAVAPSVLLLSISMLLIYSHHILIVHLSCFSNDTHKLLFCNQHSLILIPSHPFPLGIILLSPFFIHFYCCCCCLFVLFFGCCFYICIKYFFLPSIPLSLSVCLFLCFSNDGKDGGEYYNKQHSNSTTINSNCRDNIKK